MRNSVEFTRQRVSESRFWDLWEQRLWNRVAKF